MKDNLLPLFYLIFLLTPCIAFFCNIVVPSKWVHKSSTLWSGILLVSYTVLWFYIQRSECYHFNEFFAFRTYTVPIHRIYNYTHFTFGCDIYTLLFSGLVIIIFTLCFYYSAYTVDRFIRSYYGVLWSIYLLLLLVFSVLDLFLFYIVFEMLLLPMFFLIGVWGARVRRVKAAMYFYMYTATFSFFFFYALVALGAWFNVFDYMTLKYVFFAEDYPMSWLGARVLWICFFMTFAAKLPIIPFHIWLPEAHVEAPTVGSVILASLFLKLGAYGLIRFVLPFFQGVAVYYSAVVGALLLTSVLYATLVAMVQVDIKKIIAYSSIAHMNFATIGLFTFNLYGFSGGVLLFIGHGFISAAMFFLAGMLIERFGSRLMKYYSGVGLYTPQMASYFLFFSFANIGFPGTVNFVAELLVMAGLVVGSHYLVAISLGVSFVCSLFYSVWVYNKIFYGVPNTIYLDVDGIPDLFYYEKVVLTILASFTLIFGLAPTYLLVLFWSPV